MTVTKDTLADEIADRFALNHAGAKEIVDVVFDKMASSLTAGEDIRITGFGAFEVKDRRCNKLGNMPAKQFLHIAFSPSQVLKDRVNRK